MIAVDGRVHQGHDGTAGELGHQTIDPDGPPCGCGNHGCVEAFARADRIAAACGTATAEEAVARARAGDPRALEGLALIGRYLGIGIANMIVVLSPDRVVIGGGVAAAGDLLFTPIRDELARAGADDVARRRRAGAGGARGLGRRDRGGGPRRGAGGGRRAECRRERRPRRPATGAGSSARCASGSTSSQPGDPLPSDTALCEEFGVSRMTARNAMQRLADEGLIVRDPGTRQLRRRARRPTGAPTG